jgi:hypothetical protein
LLNSRSKTRGLLQSKSDSSALRVLVSISLILIPPSFPFPFTPSPSTHTNTQTPIKPIHTGPAPCVVFRDVYAVACTQCCSPCRLRVAMLSSKKKASHIPSCITQYMIDDMPFWQHVACCVKSATYSKFFSCYITIKGRRRGILLVNRPRIGKP